MGTTVSFITLLLWLLPSLIALRYIVYEANRTREVMAMFEDDERENNRDNQLQIFALQQRYIRERNLFFIACVAAIIGFIAVARIVAALIFEITLPVSISTLIVFLLILLMWLIARQSYLTHKHHHEYMQRITAKLVQTQLTVKRQIKELENGRTVST